MAAVGSFTLFLVCLLVLMATRTPVGVALSMVTVAGVVVFISPGALSQLASAAFALSSNFILVVVPMFILMGEVLSATGIGAALFRAAELWFRRLPGALAIATVWACAGFGSVCGSSPVTASTIGAMAVPQMMKRGYKSTLALGATAAGGTLGILIPPSITMIVYGVITDTSVGHLFMAGIVPGIMLAALMSVTIVVLVLRYPSWAPPVRAHRQVALDALLRDQPGNGGLLVAELIDQLEIDRLTAGEDPSVRDFFEQRVIHAAPLLHQTAEPRIGILHQRLQSGARFGTGRFKTVGRGLQRRRFDFLDLDADGFQELAENSETGTARRSIQPASSAGQ